MNISWYGHRCIRIECKEGTVLIDPFDPKKVGLRGPNVGDDLVLISEADPGSAVLERIGDASFVVRGPGEYERKGIAVRGLQAWQDTQKGHELGLCTIYSIVAEDISVCHLGAIGQDKLTSEQLEAIGDPDILIVPVGVQSAFDVKAAAALVTDVEPKIVIPIQFSLPNASYEAAALEKFVKEIGLQPERVDTFRVAKKQLPVDRTQLVVLEA
ncbi:MAG: MBL fold metallo-hydrolase [Candidatus Yanofskybacteria bacterium]|nr:MBL fold metallo-hydrolase [Candidatus Yanofskybacteria bacterium]